MRIALLRFETFLKILRVTRVIADTLIMMQMSMQYQTVSELSGNLPKLFRLDSQFPILDLHGILETT